MANKLRPLMELEDRARALRNRIDGRADIDLTLPLTVAEGRELADVLTQALQAIRELL